tara:strand:+ start:1036 stop:3543 length:2508 start_codon:yes stop_codon:yes gene_type:complete
MFDKLLLGAAGGGAAEPAPPTNLDLDLSNMSYGGATTEIVGFHRDASWRNPKGFHWKPDGTEIYVAGYDYIDQYSLTTAWDLSTLSFTARKSTTAVGNGDVYISVLPDGTKTIVNGNNIGEHKVATLSTAWDISSMGVQHSTGALSVNGIKALKKITFNDTGTKCFVNAQDATLILEFDLSTAWDITTATFSGDSDSYLDLYGYTGGSGFKYGVVFKSDGLSVLFVDGSTRRVYSADLTTAWDLGTITNIKYGSLSSLNYDPENLNAKPDGTKVFVADGSDKSVYEYDLTTAWDASTLSYNSVLNASTYITSSSFSSCSFKSDGTALYVGQYNDKIHEYTLPNAWTFANATYNQASPAGLFTRRFRSIDFFNSGLKALVIDEYYLYEYSLSTAYDISTINTTYTQRVPLTDFSGSVNFAQWTDGAYLFLIDSNRILKKYTFSTAYDISTLSHVSQNKVVDARKAYAENHSNAGGDRNPFYIYQNTWNSNGTKLYVSYFVSNTEAGIAVFNLSTAWDLSTASFDSFNVEDPSTHNNRTYFSSTFATAPRDISWGSSGSKFYMMGPISTLYELSASTNYDIGAYTAAWDWPTDIQAIEKDGRGYGLWFKPDGTKVYTAGNYSDQVNQYNLSTAWNINTMPYSPSSQLSTQENWKGLFFSNDGSTLWLLNDYYDSVDEYSLSTNWEVNTASFVQRRTEGAMSLSIIPEGLWFSSDGSKLWILSNPTIYEVGLSTAWDISTASATGTTFSFATPPPSDNYNSFIFSEDGKTILAITYGGTVTRYTASTAWDTGNFSLHSTHHLPTGGNYNFALHAPRNGAYLVIASGYYPNKLTKLNLT